ncbi:inorganic phosphate transporter [Synechococcus elongatus]|uniref:Phosphate transporter n=1 Tax=Synechococcus elongatus PCC 11801 TaxID=2219813 RepID=A0AAN1UTL6_SYNEL|nr:inorganic phosphate transporter [Synechococcus elongatus]AZB71661.1 inorganic phosphate transporter [Synechococcus elongatus PCC 11801]
MIAALLELSSSDRSWLILGVLLCLLFELINGFHDSANTIAPLIYSRVLTPLAAVVWSSVWNLVGAIASSGAVAFGIVALLPPTAAGQSPDWWAVAALLLVAIAWNWVTWWRGIPLSSSQTLIGALIGVHWGQLWSEQAWTWQALTVPPLPATVEALLLSPLLGFALAYGLLSLVRSRLQSRLDPLEAPSEPPLSWRVRGSLLLASAGMSLSHGTNDGQKGMGLLLLILATALPDRFATALDQHYLPLGIKAIVALSLAIGTLIGWQRITHTLGEAMGDRPLTTAQALSASTVTTATILTASAWGLPISTTQVLTAGIAGSTLATQIALNRQTIRRLLWTWLITLPIAIGSALLLYSLGRVIGA